ncbi:hypothetical protein G4B88_005046 [Cannabis sativa]|uniref:C2H2-type domain-containing protein n=1 Tax=Cannabis sativa TaxID=3483 RepID=A0A7J6H5Y6_CANSA|nr:hypothetical protein G4B88_005046 [Cannabis sativa]
MRFSMEFKFRAVDHRPHPPLFNSSAPPFSAQHFLPPMNFMPDTRPIPSNGLPFGDFRYYPGPTCDPVGRLNTASVLEFGRERASDDIILSEIARRRELEMVLRRDIMLLEQEFDMRRDTTSKGLVRLGETQYSNHRFPMVDSFHERLTVFEAVPLVKPLDNIGLNIDTTPAAPEKDKLIVLAKPNPNDFGAKRKATTPPALDENEEQPPFGMKKKPKEEWSCALCQVTATNEKNLNQHLQSKKHKAREARLLPKKNGNCSINVPLKKTGNPSKPPMKCTETSSALEVKADETASTLELPDCVVLEVKAEVEEKPLELNETAENLESTLQPPIPEVANEGEIIETVQTDEKAVKEKKNKPKNFQFWCEMCQVGCYSLKVMDDHQQGKKHKNKLCFYKPKETCVVDLTTNVSFVEKQDPISEIQAKEMFQVPKVENQAGRP